jgi:hypothetical protein
MIGRAVSWQVVLLLALTMLVTVRWTLPVTSGLRVEYDMAGDRSDVPPPSISHVSTNDVASAWNRRPPDVFRARWSGYLIVPRAGSYTFALTSDDGSTLRLDDTLVVDNSGDHASQTRSGQIALERGPHAVIVDFTQSGGTYEIEWQWARDGGVVEPVPAWSLSPYKMNYGTVLLVRLLERSFVPALVASGILVIWTAFPPRSRWRASSV